MSDNLDEAEIICVVLQNETILIGELIDGSLADEIITIREAAAIVATTSEDSEDGEPDNFYIRDFFSQLVDEGRCFTFRSQNLLMVFYPPEMGIESYYAWRESCNSVEIDLSDEDGELSEPEVSNTTNDDNVIHFNPSDEI